MKVSIKHLSITFMGNEESKATAAPTEFYNQYERELQAKLETLRGDFNEMQRQRDSLREQRDKLIEAHKAQADELALIQGWVADYDRGQWPDHNASGVSDVSREVLHMMRDLWADLESRPLPGSVPTGWNAAELAQPVAPADPLPTVQPEPETSQTQPAAPESARPAVMPGMQAAKAKICPGFNCSNELADGQKYCGQDDCDRSQQVLEAVAMQGEPSDEGEANDKPYSVCEHKGCEEPRMRGYSFCKLHRQRKE